MRLARPMRNSCSFLLAHRVQCRLASVARHHQRSLPCPHPNSSLVLLPPILPSATSLAGMSALPVTRPAPSPICERGRGQGLRRRRCIPNLPRASGKRKTVLEARCLRSHVTSLSEKAARQTQLCQAPVLSVWAGAASPRRVMPVIASSSVACTMGLWKLKRLRTLPGRLRDPPELHRSPTPRVSAPDLPSLNLQAVARMSLIRQEASALLDTVAVCPAQAASSARHRHPAARQENSCCRARTSC